MLAAKGLAIHWLHPREKRPIGDDWSTKPVHTPETLKAGFRDGYNVGIRLGEPSKIDGLFLHVLDMDIRLPEAAADALEALHELLPEVDTFPFVISGSAGASRHFYLLSDVAFRSKKLVHSGVKFTDDRGKQHWTWEIELFGTGKQVAAPPSIHPDTGKPYVWGRPIDFELIEMGIGPVVSSTRVAEWVGTSSSTAVSLDTDDDEDLLAYTRRLPMGLSDQEVKETLRDLPLDDYCEDRDGWMIVGMALHHEFEGSDKGLDYWNAFSKRSAKFDAKDQRRVWESFKGRPNPVRMATLIKAAGIARLEGEHEEGDDGFDEPASDDEIDDLLGGCTAANDAEEQTHAAGEGAEGRADKRWRSKLDLNAEGAVKSTLHNVRLIIESDPRTRDLPAFNVFSRETVQRGAPGRLRQRSGAAKETLQLGGEVWDLADPVNGDLWVDDKDDAIRSVLEAPKTQGGYGMKVSDRDLRSAIDIVARKRSFHPVREYLGGLVWDGHRRVETLFIRYLGANDDAYTRAIARLFMVAAVARVMKPGHKFDFAVILEGLQGKRKTTFIQILAKNWFAELDGDFHDTKQMIELMQSAWILEIPELTSFGKARVSVIKAFISRQVDKARLSYARRADRFPRQCVFMGSTNDSQYLKDDTGGRRFWPIACHVDQIDTAKLKAQIDELWAEAKALHDEMRLKQPNGDLPLYLTDEEAQRIAVELQESRRIETAEDAMAGQIGRWLDTPVADEDGFDGDVNASIAELRRETCLRELWVECLGRDRAAYSNLDAAMIGRAMRQVAGWRQVDSPRVTIRYGKQRVYRRIENTTQQAD